jgi:hypothetical protein
MISRALAVLMIASLTLVGGAWAEEIDFNRDVRPILSDNCFACHGFDAASREAELRLDTREGALAEVIVAGKPEASELIARVTSSDPDELMPTPESHKKPLAPEAVATLTEWIRQGAPWGDHWSFVAPAKAPVPDGVHPIDFFVGEKLKSEGLAMSRPAAPHTIRRRLSTDLIGLPLAPERTDQELDALVDELLASPHFGERMAMWWLDGARYSDTDGFQADATRSNWPWRDWVVDAFNANMPFDQFTLEQFAGDLLPDATPEQILATCFHRNHMTNGEGGRDPAESRVDYVLDRTNTTGTLFLGLTLGCTQCHDHKFDPVSQADYYSLSAYFDSIDEDGKAGGGAKPYMSYRSPYANRALDEAQALLDASGAELSALRESRFPAFERWLANQIETTRDGFAPWHRVIPGALAAKEGSVLNHEGNGIVQLGKQIPAQDDLTVTIGTMPLSRVAGMRLEVFPHESHVGGKFTQAEDGEFILTNVKLRVRREGDTQVRDIALKRAVADVNGKGRDSKYSNVSGTLDDDPRTGWTTRQHAGDKPHRAVFELTEPVELGEGEILDVVLMHRSLDARAVIGRFRLSLTDQRGHAVRGLGKMPVEQLAEGAKPEGDLRKKLLDQFLEDDAAYRALAARHAEVKRQHGEIKKATGDVKVMVLAEREKPRKTHVLVRGVWDAHGDEVKPAVLPAVLKRDGVGDRLALAKWITSAENPLTARVISNQVWQLFFGAGLVRTPNDFGLQGEVPTHPELLDWLAVDFIESGWDLKRLVKTIVSSATYRQSSLVSPDLLERDPENRLLARGARYRLPSWMIRDAFLTHGGLLNPALGGPPVFPYQPPGIWSDQFMGRFTYRPSLGPAGNRRTLYAFWRRSSAPTFLFDNAMRRTCEVAPRRTNTPLQALTMLNDKTPVEAARALAKHDTAAIFRRVLSRDPSAEELAVCQRQYDRALAFYQNDADAAAEFSGGGDANLAAMTLLANMVLNLDETVTHE